MVHRSAVAVACALLAALALASGEVYSAKQLSGPPEEFADHMIPAAAVGAESSSTETYWVKLAPTADGDMQWASHVPVDSTTFEFAIFSQEIASLSITLKDPSGATVDLASHKVDTGFPTGDESQIYDDATFQLTNMVAGVYTLELSAPAGTFEPYADSPAGFDAFIMFMVDSNDMLFTQFADYTSLVQGQQVASAKKKKKNEKTEWGKKQERK